jgi:hypothetical protein
MVEREKGSTRPMILRPGSKKPEPYLRASEVHKLIEDKYGLNLWQQDRIGYMVATDEKLRAEWAATDVEAKGQAFWDRKALREKTIRAYTAGKSYNRQAAAQGTRFHSITDKHDQGALFELDEDYADDLGVYTYALEKAGLHIIASERFVVQDDLGIAGTFDKLIDTELPTPDGMPANLGGPVIADLKTGKVKGKELEFGMQMAVYANSVFYENGERSDLDANREWGLIIHLPLGSNQVELIWVNINECYEMVKAAITVKEGRKPRVVSAMVIPGPTLEDKIISAPSKAALVQLYKNNVDIWFDGLTDLANKRSAELG